MIAEIIQFNGPRSKAVTPKRRRRSESSLTWFKAFGARLRATRLMSGISEAEAAAACLATLRTYRKYEEGLPHRSWHRGLISFAQKYDLTYAWLLAGEGPMRVSECAEVIKRQYLLVRKPKLTLVSGRSPS